ncbi:hypothetical protein LCGC14_2882650 [marine sediment metagenome]|uniref:SF4 helicase domain-containing protein n=1 Tax=marine sediment metagenome TaxID=412755 RepID=A0A0F9A7L9_9ZZZZ
MTLVEATPAQLRGFRTLDEHVQALRTFAANPRQRVRTGIQTLDIMTEGPAAGEIYLIMGRSYSGKSQVAMNIMAYNADLPLLFFSMEMPARQAAQRLLSIVFDVDHHDILNQIKAGSLASQYSELGERLPRQVIIDDSNLTLGDMTAYVDQYESYFEERPAAIIVDYLELVSGNGGNDIQSAGWQNTESVARALKAWAKNEDMAVFVLHQTNRNEKVWAPPDEDSARGAGYTEADVVVGMWQPGRDPEKGATERSSLTNHITMNVLKNRITGRTTDGKDILLKLEPTLRLVDLKGDQNETYTLQKEKELAVLVPPKEAPF